MSQRAPVLAAARTALSGAGKPPDLTVLRGRARNVEAAELPVAIVGLDSEGVATLTNKYGPLVKRTAVLFVELRLDVADDEDLEDAAEPYALWCVQALLGDAALRALVEHIAEKGTAWAAADQDQLYARVTVAFTIEYTSAVANPASRT